MSDPATERRRLSFGTAASAYARLRPAYPDALVDWVLAAARRPVLDVADLGAGTGALTRTLVGRAARVTAHDPDVAMLAELVEQVPAARRVVSRAEQLPVPDSAYDAVLCGASWHWFDDESAAREITRVLRPGGVLGLLWHVRDDREGWMHALTDVLAGDEGMRDPATGERMAARIAAVLPGVERRSLDVSVRMPVEDLVELVGTYSTVIVAPDPDDVRARVRHLLRGHPATAGREQVDVPYIVRAYRWSPSTPTPAQPGGTA